MIADNNVDTKTRIFLTASQMFALNGYESVSMRTIADAVGIKASSIYNHYTGKEAILDACYDYYTAHRYDTRLHKDQYVPILRDGTKQEVLGVINYAFAEVMIMFYLALIVFSRVYTDPKARRIYREEVDNALEYINEYFRCGIEMGRFQDFNVSVYSMICLNARLFTVTSATLDPDQKKWRVTEIEIFNELAKALPFNY